MSSFGNGFLGHKLLYRTGNVSWWRIHSLGQSSGYMQPVQLFFR